MIPFRIVAAILSLSMPAAAQECKISYDQLLVDIKTASGEIVGGATYEGTATVEMIIVDINGMIVMFGLDSRDCLVGQIVVESSKSGPKSGA